MPYVQPGPSDIMPFRALAETLPNGLRVIVVPTGFPDLVSLQIPVQTGSRNEVEPGKSGFAHFFEHMMFRGTRRFPPEAYQAVLTRAGASHNAYTTDDYTNYHTTFGKDDLESILEIEADRFMNLEYGEPEFRTEARAILGEYNKSAADPLTKLLEVQRDHAFTTHTYRHTTMGFIADIEAMPEQYDYSRLFFKRWYLPQYTTVIVAGDVQPEATLELVRKYFGSWAQGEAAPVAIPGEPGHRGPLAVHVPWTTATLPWVTVAVHGPAFSTAAPDFAALDTLFDVFFGETSDLYQRLVEREQVVDQLFPWHGSNVDPGLFTVLARVKRLEDTSYVRDQVMEALGQARGRPIDERRLEDAKSNMRYSFARTLDNTESIAATIARFVRFDRSYDTLNALFRRYASLTTADLFEAAKTYVSDARLVQATLAEEAPPPALAVAPSVPAPAPVPVPAFPVITKPSASTLLRFKLLFTAGSAHDPAGKEGLAALSAAMISEAGSQQQRIDEITRALFPMAGSFHAQVDREMTVFTGVIHRDNVDRFLAVVLPQLKEPGFREDDFARLKAVQRNALVQDLRSSNEEELGKERLQANVFAGTPYGHPVAGTVSGIDALTLDDVRAFAAGSYTQARLALGIAGKFPEAAADRLRDGLARLPAGSAGAAAPIAGRRPDGLDVEIIEKETRSTAISFGHPLEVRRGHPDFAALWLARTWFGEHRASHGRLFQRLREVRGLNYGNYAYIEAFPRGMYQFQPDPNLGRRAQLFEVWIRPVAPEHGVFALKAALWELRRLIDRGLSPDAFESIREYAIKSLFVLTKTQDQQLGYALDSSWYGMGDFVETMREGLRAVTREQVNGALRRHLSGSDLSVVMIAKDAAALREELLSGAFTAIHYDSPKPEDVLAEDREIGALELGLTPERVRVTPVEAVFA
jgi:zinc protease